MSRDYHVMVKQPVSDPSELTPEGVTVVGDARSIREAIAATAPDVAWHDWGGSLERDDGWIEFCVPEAESELEAFTVRTSHRTDPGWELAVLDGLCAAHDWIAFDGETGTFVAGGRAAR